jgi:hypothetical protein
LTGNTFSLRALRGLSYTSASNVTESVANVLGAARVTMSAAEGAGTPFTFTSTFSSASQGGDWAGITVSIGFLITDEDGVLQTIAPFSTNVNWPDGGTDLGDAVNAHLVAQGATNYSLVWEYDETPLVLSTVANGADQSATMTITFNGGANAWACPGNWTCVSGTAALAVGDLYLPAMVGTSATTLAVRYSDMAGSVRYGGSSLALPAGANALMQWAGGTWIPVSTTAHAALAGLSSDDHPIYVSDGGTDIQQYHIPVANAAGQLVGGDLTYSLAGLTSTSGALRVGADSTPPSEYNNPSSDTSLGGNLYTYGNAYFDGTSIWVSGESHLAGAVIAHAHIATRDDCIATQYIAGTALVLGEVVKADANTDYAVIRAPADSYEAIGTVRSATCVAGEACTICVAGRAPCLLEDGTSITRGYWCRTAESGGTDGRCDCNQFAPNPPTNAEHSAEIGHAVMSNSSGTNVIGYVNLHFN